MFPEGIFYDKENNSYRTENENTAFTIFRKLSASYKIAGTKKEPLLSDSYGLVAPTGLEPVFKV